MVTLSLHAAEFGVGTMAAGSMLVSPRAAISVGIAPGEETLAIVGVESGKAVALSVGFPGVDVHPVGITGLPSGEAGAIVPMLLPIIPGAVEVEGVMTPVVDVDPTASGAGVVVVIWIAGAEQLMLVPGVVGSSASGTGARVVTGAPGSVVAENGPGPFSGDETMAPGVEGIPIAVVPIVETCATAAVPYASSATIAVGKYRIGRLMR